MTVNDIATLACNECGDSGAEMLAYVKTQIRMKYEILYNSHPWEESQIQPHYEFAAQAALPVPNSLAYWMPQILPLTIDKVLWAKGSIDNGASFPLRMQPRPRSWIEKVDEGTILTQANTPQPRYFFHGQPLGFPAYSPLVLTFTPVGTASQITLTVEGRTTAGLEVVEDLTVNGTSPISTANSFAEVHGIQKTVSGGVPIVVTASGSTVAATIQTVDQKLRYTVLVLWPAYTGSPPLTMRVGGKLKVDRLTDNNSTPRISGLHTALYYFARASVHGKQKQWDLEDADSKKSEEIFSKLVEFEMASEAAFQQIVPVQTDDPAGVWDYSW